MELFRDFLRNIVKGNTFCQYSENIFLKFPTKYFFYTIFMMLVQLYSTWVSVEKNDCVMIRRFSCEKINLCHATYLKCNKQGVPTHETYAQNTSLIIHILPMLILYKTI